MQQDQASPDAGLDAARAFIEKADWSFASTMWWSPHEYCVRHRCRAQGIEDEFEDFVRLIEADGYWRLWGLHRWRSLTVDDHVYWLHWNLCTVEERMIVNRWWRDRMAPSPPN